MRSLMGLFKLYSIFLLISSVTAWRAYKIHLESVTVDLPEKDMVEIKVDLLNNSRGEQIMNVEYNIKKELTHLYIRGLAKITNRNTEFVFINKTMNMCKYFEESSSNVIMKLIFDEMTKKGLNINSCPVQVGSYFSRGFHVNDNRFPPIIPQGRVLMKIDQYTGTSEHNLTRLATMEVIATIKSNLGKAFRING